MNIRKSSSALFSLVFCLVAVGCKKPNLETLPVPLVLPAVSPGTVLRIHWLGKKQLGNMASAYYVTRLWQLPETRQLEAQTLQKLAVSPWRLMLGEAAVSNAPAALFGPLLEDVIKEECYFEIRESANGSRELAFAVRLDEARAGVWRTNLVGVIATVTGIQTMDLLDGGRGWMLKRQQSPNRFELARAGEWTVFGLAQDTNNLMGQVLNLVRQPQTHESNAQSWLTADFDLLRLKKILPMVFQQSDDLPRVSVSVSGDGGNVITHARMDFPKPLSISFEPWTIPTNLIHEPLTSFTVTRGFDEASPIWDSFGTFPFSKPDQLCAWAMEKNSFQTYFAFPLGRASNELVQLTHQLLEKANPWLAARGYVGFEPLAGGAGVAWGNLPTVRPFLRSISDSSQAFLFGGLLPPGNTVTNPPLRRELLDRLSSRTNLVAYDWERTDARVEADLQIAQLSQVLLRKTQLPVDSLSVNWLRSISARLFESETTVTLSGTNQLSFERRSTCGFTGVELVCLADWLESPTFPLGLHSFGSK